MHEVRTPVHAGVQRRDRALGLPLAVLISLGFHLVVAGVAFLWPRPLEEKPQITLDLVDEAETQKAEAKAAEPTPEEAAKTLAEQLLKVEREKEKKPEERAREKKPEPEKLARVEPPKAPPEPEKRPAELKILPLPPEKAPPPPKHQPPPEKKPEEKKPEPPKPTPLPPELRRMKMVDQDHDKNEPENKDAEFLAQKNRRVQEQTRARDTNLERQQRGDSQGSAKSDNRDEQVGGPKEKVAELAEERSHLERKAPNVTPHKDEQLPEQRDAKPKNLLSMRNLPKRAHDVITRGSEAEALRQSPDGILHGREDAKQEASLARREQQARNRGTGPTMKLSLNGRDYDKVVGRDEQERVRRLAQREMSHHKGRWERKWGAIKSSLENFVPEVRVGNQTALNTRAMPFASYIARMHRGIHKLWGFGVLEDWDTKASSSALNDMSRWTMLEIILNGDGTVDKVTVVRPSGYLPFDVAAMDVVLSAGPYPDPPGEIKSANGKIYLHWRFHRDSRQCATFGVDPYILTTPPKGPADKPALPTDGEEVGRPRGPERGLPTPGAKNVTRSLRRPVALTDHTYRGPAPEARAREEKHEHEEPDPEEARRVAARVARAADPAARKAADLWVAAYQRGDLEALLAYSRLPFRSGEKYVAKQPSELRKLYRTVLDEAGGKRGAAKLEIFSAAGLRGKLGALPRGVDENAGYLFALARAGTDLFVLVLSQEGVGEWKVVGLAR